MLAYLVVSGVALFASALTLFSGFGLGTLLLPAFAFFFPIPVAVAATAVVHGLNNFFKLALIGRHAERSVVTRFGIPALAAAFLGAWVLTRLPATPWWTWHAAGRAYEVTPVGLTMGALILFFALFELAPALSGLRASPRWLWLGGLLSGFFGGLSGHQGALRAAFLGRLGLSPTTFAATQTAIGTMVDVARLLVYGLALLGGEGARLHALDAGGLVVAATLCAFVGAWLGTRMLPKITIGFVRGLTGVLLVLIGLGLASGVI